MPNENLYSKNKRVLPFAKWIHKNRKSDGMPFKFIQLDFQSYKNCKDASLKEMITDFDGEKSIDKICSQDLSRNLSIKVKLKDGTYSKSLLKQVFVDKKNLTRFKIPSAFIEEIIRNIGMYETFRDSYISIFVEVVKEYVPYRSYSKKSNSSWDRDDPENYDMMEQLMMDNAWHGEDVF